MGKFDELLEQLQKHLDCSVQNWFLGAGVSVESNIPLMYSLTQRVEALVREKESSVCIEIYDALKKDLPENCHIEHILSHIGDLLALAERSFSKSSQFSGRTYSEAQLKELYRALIKYIGITIRYGFRAADPVTAKDEQIGTPEFPIVEIEHHRNFLKALFGTRANLERRSRISIFTVNYDTLLEDALCLERRFTMDGFSGGSMGYWNPSEEFLRAGQGDKGVCKLFKLHGSVDWYHDDKQGLIRSRYGVKYLADPAQILLYPQATKYVETQKDPFATLFLGFRQALTLREDNILAICGYSFGDSHINTEIMSVLQDAGNKTTMLVFTCEKNGGLSSPLCDWLANKVIAEKIFVATQKGLYNGSPKCEGYTDGDLRWWSFSGLTEFLKNGETL